jgi:hypothetical protein
MEGVCQADGPYSLATGAGKFCVARGNDFERFLLDSVDVGS